MPIMIFMPAMTTRMGRCQSRSPLDDHPRNMTRSPSLVDDYSKGLAGVRKLRVSLGQSRFSTRLDKCSKYSRHPHSGGGLVWWNSIRRLGVNPRWCLSSHSVICVPWWFCQSGLPSPLQCLQDIHISILVPCPVPYPMSGLGECAVPCSSLPSGSRGQRRLGSSHWQGSESRRQRHEHCTWALGGTGSVDGMSVL